MDNTIESLPDPEIDVVKNVTVTDDYMVPLAESSTLEPIIDLNKSCNVCKYCLDKKKRGGKNKLKQRCVQKPKTASKRKIVDLLEESSGRVLRRKYN